MMVYVGINMFDNSNLLEDYSKQVKLSNFKKVMHKLLTKRTYNK
jgi:hypothetical protein